MLRHSNGTGTIEYSNIALFVSALQRTSDMCTNEFSRYDSTRLNEAKICCQNLKVMSGYNGNSSNGWDSSVTGSTDDQQGPCGVPC